MHKNALWLALTGFFILQAPAGLAAPSKGLPGWVIKQKMEYQGNLDIKACNSGACVTTRTLCVYMKPNSKDITLVNTENKTITKADARIWADQGRMNAMLVKDVSDPKVLKQFKIQVSPPRTIAGHKSTQHWAAAYRPDHRFWFWWEYWTTNDINVPQEFSDRWRTMIHLPSGEGIPLLAIRHFQMNHKDHVEHTLLTTTEAKKITLAANDLEPPKGFKQVGDELDALMGSSDDKDEIDELFATKGKDAKKK